MYFNTHEVESRGVIGRIDPQKPVNAHNPANDFNKTGKFT
jgi:hypothetical protein